MHIESKINIHNRFDVHVDNIKTREHKEYKGYNILLDRIYTRLCNGSAYFGAIHFGTGTGTPAASDTALFSYLGGKYATTEETIKAIPVSSLKRKIVLAPEEYVGQTITELGIADSSSAATLNTKAMIKDSEGNPISITKTDTDVITIYATVFITFNTSKDYLKWIGVDSETNKLINYLVGGASAPTGSFKLLPGEGQGTPLGSTSSATWTADIPNKKRKTNVLRFSIDTANGNAMGFEFSNLFAVTFPATGVHTGREYVDVPLATGDGVTKKYTLPSKNIDLTSIVVKSDGVTKSNYTKEKIRAINFTYDRNGATSIYTYGSAITPDGTKAVISHRNTPWLSTYFLGSNYDRTNIEPDGNAGDPYSIAMTPDGLALASIGPTSPYLMTYDWNGASWIKRPTPADAPGGYGYGIALSDNGLVLANVGNTVDVVMTYDWNGTAWIKRPVPADKPAGIGNGAALSADGSIMAVGISSSPWLYTYDWSGTAWIKRTAPADPPTSNVSNIYMSPDGDIMAIVENSSPYVRVYDWSGTAWIKRANPTTLPNGAGKGVSLTPDGSIMAVGFSNSPYVYLYDWSGTAWIKRESAVTFVASPNSITINRDGNKLIWTSSSTPYAVISDIKARDTTIEFDAAEASGKAITVDYTVDGVHKTVNQVIDVSFSIQFGEGV